MAVYQKVLLVDDEREFLELMSRFFTRRQLEFAVAGSCKEALAELDRDHFDVVVMDISMPGKNGLECMLEMKKADRNLEIIILTGHGTPAKSVEGMKQGAFDYCMKPVDIEELLEKIQLARKAITDRGL